MLFIRFFCEELRQIRGNVTTEGTERTDGVVLEPLNEGVSSDQSTRSKETGEQIAALQGD